VLSNSVGARSHHQESATDDPPHRCAARARHRAAVAGDRGVPIGLLTNNVEELVSRGDIDLVSS
jgi:hypothetical protein